MNSLPLAIENIVNDYKYQLEHKDSFQASLQSIKSMIQVDNDFNNCGMNNDYYERDWIQIYKEYEYYNICFDICIKCGEYEVKDKCGCNMYFKYSWYKEQRDWIRDNH